METKLNFTEKVSKLIFLEFKKESIPKIFKIEVNENLYLPVRPLRVADKVKNNEKFEKIPVSFFIEGMFYVLGGDENFKFNQIYIDILNANKEEAVQYIKGIVFEEVKKSSYEDAHILLKGLLKIEENVENYDKIIMILEELRKIDKNFQQEELAILDKAEKLQGYYKAYFNKAVIYYEQEKYEDAWFYINTYIEKSKDNSKNVLELKHILSNIRQYDKGKALVYDKPKEALMHLIPLLDEFSNDAILNFNIAVAYRVLGNYEKAIYYLNESVAIDSSIVEVINELGINYAALNNYDIAIKYLRKAFEATKSIEVCTNLIMCYINNGDTKQAKLHYDIAKKINPKDEIVLQLSKVLGE